MTVQLIEEPAARLHDYGHVPIAFEVTDRLDVDRISIPSAQKDKLPTRPVRPSYLKDYDRGPGQRPTDWPSRWDMSKWRFIAAYRQGQRVGSAALVMDTADVEEISAGTDMALLWDIRVRLEDRNQGIGRQMISYAESLARGQGCEYLKVETQDVNIAACCFYHRAGYLLTAINRQAYPELPDEVQLIWKKDLRVRT